jgi:ribosome-interacting GTPase 1
MKINFQSPPKNIDEKMVYNILRDYKMLNCEVLIRDENGNIMDQKVVIPAVYFAHYLQQRSMT